MQWTDWVPLSRNPDQVGATVYQVRLLEDGKPFPIPRMTVTDPEGVLMIAETSGLVKRLRKFRRAISSGTGSHSEGELWYFVTQFSPVKERSTLLEYRYVSLPCKQAAETRKVELLKDYIARFGELPPLNCAIPKRFDANTWHIDENS